MTVERNLEGFDILSHKELRRHFDAHTAARLVELGIEASFSQGKILFEPGDQSGQFYFITLGSVAIEEPGRSEMGRNTRIETLHAGDLLGWSALLGSGTRHFRARALSRVSTIAFDGALLRQVCEKDPRFGYALMSRLLLLVTERLDATRARLDSAQED